MSALVRTPECFPTELRIGGVLIAPAPAAAHERCPGGHHMPGVIGGWYCPCRCHHNGGKPAEPRIFDCDWGACNAEAVDSRWADDLGEWLAVCADHSPSPLPAVDTPTTDEPENP